MTLCTTIVSKPQNTELALVYMYKRIKCAVDVQSCPEKRTQCWSRPAAGPGVPGSAGSEKALDVADRADGADRADRAGGQTRRQSRGKEADCWAGRAAQAAQAGT